MHIIVCLDNGKEHGRFPIPDIAGPMVIKTTAGIKITIEKWNFNKNQPKGGSNAGE